MAKELSPFAATALAGWGAVLIGEPVRWDLYAASLILLAAAWTYGVAAGLRGHLSVGTVVGALGFLGALALMRAAAHGVSAGVSVLVLLPVLHTALSVHSRRALAIVIGGVLAFCLIPVIVVGPPQYPHSAYRSAMLIVAVSAIIGLVTQRLVTDIRRRARRSRERERMLVRVNHAFQQLLDGPNSRHDVCAAITQISGATVALLVEAIGQELRYTATSAPTGRGIIEQVISEGSAVYTAYHSAQRQFINRDTERHVGNQASWATTGRPRTGLYTPLIKNGRTVGVLIAAWADALEPDDPRVSVAELFARQMAVVIDNADVIDRLTDEAHRDPLTRLPNRRAWEVRLAAALADPQPLVVAMFDIDHFKDYNDTYGHPAGDSLLEHAATGWQSELRSTDFLARLGGEEFGLLLPGTDRHTAETIVERVRSTMPGQETCSAGITLRTAEDDAETLVARADHALYEAKADGRDRTILLLGHGSRTLVGRPVVDLDVDY